MLREVLFAVASLVAAVMFAVGAGVAAGPGVGLMMGGPLLFAWSYAALSGEPPADDADDEDDEDDAS